MIGRNKDTGTEEARGVARALFWRGVKSRKAWFMLKSEGR
nr:MAG TPA: hypothetical protein [Caudoviricetes sp.]